MRQLLRSSDVDSNGALFREPFLQRLPQSTRLVLASAGDLTLDRLAQLADRVHDATSATVAAISPTPELSVLSRLESRIDQLAASIDALRTSPHNHRGVSTRQGHRASSPSSPRSRSPRGPPICWYHRTYQHHAHRCRLVEVCEDIASPGAPPRMALAVEDLQQ
ncbi:hypothetical protein HPB50_019228 [Hyalomma asiaticum]|uniref:Uncharacterized protein n=2 Tax=Hyalomma asiaticum TaxID=266040 RepID=A0ACB7RU23_HYAAI|nr:hypothetical protein HPB50_018630 [Hyalomma asiaticum]KAH6926508.1 hypothetical protein HPB50_019228 [Hyalomma asiaticum]